MRHETHVGSILQVSAPAIGTAEHGANDVAFVNRHEAEAAVQREIRCDRLAIVPIAKNDAIRRTPEAHDGVVIGREELPQLDLLSVRGRHARRCYAICLA